MKKVILGLSALCMIAFVSCKKDAAAKITAEDVSQAAEKAEVMANADFPAITFDKSEHDFGEIMDGTPVETTFTYTNSGKAPLVVTDIKSTCGCTVPSGWTKDPLAPGESGEFTVKFNGKGNGNTSKTVTITSNTEKGKETVKIRAFVKKDPNAPATADNKPKAVKTSTQPGHEGHNHN